MAATNAAELATIVIRLYRTLCDSESLFSENLQTMFFSCLDRWMPARVESEHRATFGSRRNPFIQLSKSKRTSRATALHEASHG